MSLVVAATMAGCGGDDSAGNGDDGGDFVDRSATDIVDVASEAMGELSTVKVTGTIEADGQPGSIDVQLSNNGSCTGTFVLGGTGTIEILGVGDERWLQGDETFWTSAGVPDLSLVLDKWVVDSDGDFEQFCDIEEFVSSLFEDDTDETFEVSGTEDLDGEEVVAIEQDDSEEGLSTGYIRVDEPHHMMKIEKEGDDGGSVVFSQFDEELEVSAPSDDEIVDLDQLG